MKVYDVAQGSDSWWEAKCGRPSCSNFHRIFACATGRISDGIDAYIAELIAEREMQLPNFFTGQGKPVTMAMQKGIDLEPVAKRWYSEKTGLPVHQVGLIATDCGRWVGSPDCFVGEDGGAEVKVYSDRTHAKWLKDNVLPAQHAAQVHGYLIVSGRQWWDFVAYSETQENMIVRTEPNELTDRLRVGLEIFHERFLKALRRAGYATTKESDPGGR